MVPANLTQYNKEGDEYPLSSDGWYFTLLSDIFEGWKEANGCDDNATVYETSLDGTYDLWCLSEGVCAYGDVVRCSWNGGHDYFGNSYNTYNGKLVWEFMSQYRRPCHVGKGRVDANCTEFGDESTWYF